jgi:hypothetical protein
VQLDRIVFPRKYLPPPEEPPLEDGEIAAPLVGRAFGVVPSSAPVIEEVEPPALATKNLHQQREGLAIDLGALAVSADGSVRDVFICFQLV